MTNEMEAEFANCDIVEVEINPHELRELLSELSIIRGLQTRVIEENNEYKLYSTNEPANEPIHHQEFHVSRAEEAFQALSHPSENVDHEPYYDYDGASIQPDMDFDEKKPLDFIEQLLL